MFNTTGHADYRANQRGLPFKAINYVMDHGQIFHRAGAIFYFLRKCDIPLSDQQYKEISRLEGTAVVVSKDQQTIITVWRNRDTGLKNIKKKPRCTTKIESICV